ncbi:UNVERIFIED_CONTAM: hypothetical protein GTU68_063273 [Idotea baltica]|nr:hypothetical protein [Idotea baltica]
MAKFRLLVKTGNQHHAGTDANVWVSFGDEFGLRAPPVHLDLPLHDDLERGTLDTYTQVIPATFGRLTTLFILRDSKGRSDDWFCDYVIVQDSRGTPPGTSFRKIKNLRSPGVIEGSHRGFAAEVYFPVCRWVRAEQEYVFVRYGTSLPPDDVTKKIREEDLKEKRDHYTFVVNLPGGPTQVSSLTYIYKYTCIHIYIYIYIYNIIYIYIYIYMYILCIYICIYIIYIYYIYIYYIYYIYIYIYNIYIYIYIYIYLYIYILYIYNINIYLKNFKISSEQLRRSRNKRSGKKDFYFHTRSETISLVD